MQLIDNQARSLCMTPDIMMGENMPSSTPFRGMAVLSNAAKSAFKNIRDDVGTTIVDILIEQILPDIVKDWNKGELIEITEDEEDIKLYDEAVARKMKIELIQANMNAGMVTDPMQLQAVDQMVAEQMPTIGRKIKIEKGFFNFKYGIKINPTGEVYDKSQQNDVYFNVLSMIQANPAIQENSYFRQYVESNGLTPIRMRPQELQQQMTQMQQSQAQPAQQQDKLMYFLPLNQEFATCFYDQYEGILCMPRVEIHRLNKCCPYLEMNKVNSLKPNRHLHPYAKDQQSIYFL
jgi:hypothetical protein